MKKITLNLFSMMFLLMASAVFSQGKIKGTVLDNELKAALPGVNVMVKGSTNGASTDMDGKFILTTTATSGQVVISFVGFQSQTVNFKVNKGETVD
jgi:iron complex outermembrane receptor protein